MTVFVVALLGGIVGAAVFTYGLQIKKAFAKNTNQPDVITVSEIRLVDKNGELKGHLEVSERGDPSLHFINGINETTLYPFGIIFRQSGKDEIFQGGIGASNIELSIHPGRDTLGLNRHHRIEISSGRLNMNLPSINIWDSYRRLVWSTPTQ
jgi:hypothetical protein